MDLQSLNLRELQEYVRQQELLRGFADESSIQKCLLLGEEVGELFKAVRRAAGMSIDERSSCHEVAEELADILNFVFAIAIRHQVDLADAFEAKEVKNSTRRWHRDDS